MNDQEHKCQCDFRIRMLGDGCRYCQPQEYIDRLCDTMDGMIHTDCFELTDEEIYDILWNHFPISDKEKNATMIAVMTHCIRVVLRKAQEK